MIIKIIKKITRQEIIEWFNDDKSQPYIYGYMYGHKYINTSNGKELDRIIKIEKEKLQDTGNDSFYYRWGWPGPDINIYNWKDYGITWSFNKEDLE